MGLISKIFGTYSQRQIKKILTTVDKIEELAAKYNVHVTDSLMAKKTAK